jgi:chemotaxis protein MotB
MCRGNGVLVALRSGTFFDAGSAKFSGEGEELLRTLATELGKRPNRIAGEGHINKKPYAAGRNCGNWDLSADRANATRQLMQESGIREEQVMQVRGVVDQRLRNLKDPMDPGNRRSSLMVQYLQKKSGPHAEGDETEKAGAESGKEDGKRAEGAIGKESAKKSEHHCVANR